MHKRVVRAEGAVAGDVETSDAPRTVGGSRRHSRKTLCVVGVTLALVMLLGLGITVSTVTAMNGRVGEDSDTLSPALSHESTTTSVPATPSRPRTDEIPVRAGATGTSQHAVSSSEELRRVCHAQAPQLENTGWYRDFVKTGRNVRVLDTPPSRRTFLVMPYPVCLHLDTGRIFSENAHKRINPSRHHFSEIPLYLRNTGFHDLEDLFAYMKNSGSANDSTVQLIPAMSVMPFGSFMASHMWHLIHDGIGQLTDTVANINNEFWDVPRQGVLSDERGARWIDRGGDLPDKMRLSAYILNGFSTFTANTSSSDPNAPPVPAFVRTPLIAHSVDRPPPVLDGSVPDLVSRTVCFCQNLFTPPHGIPGHPPSPAAIAVVQDRTALSFGAPPYRPLSQESVWAIERQRVERYPPWARQFWPSSGTSSDYQPRVLFIHRARRTIANVSTYVTAMREMGFRVEEAYLERLPTEQQYYLGRYADVVVGMHGLGVGHALWMNRYPTGCRTVIEFRLWAGAGIPISLEAVLRRSAGFHYVTPEPIDVIFGPTVKDPLRARQAIKDMGHGGYTHPGWDDQEAVFNIAEVVQALQNVKLHLSECLISGQRPH